MGPTEFGQLGSPQLRSSGSIATASTASRPPPASSVELTHDEADTAQQEIFVSLISGRARFTVGDETFDAGPGTAIGVGDPSLARGHEALEPGTRVLCIGARPSAAATDWGSWIGDAGL